MNLTHEDIQNISDQILTPAQAAEVACVHRRTLYKFIDQGRLRIILTAAGHIRIWQPDAEKLRGRLPRDN